MFRTHRYPSMMQMVNLADYRLSVNFYALAFWAIFVQCYFLDRLLVVLTNGLFRASVVTALVASLPILLHFTMRSYVLIGGAAALSIAILFSAILNDSSIIQVISFVRIPIVAYLVYNLVKTYIDNEVRARRVFRLLYLIGFLQLPVLILQRLAYPVLPSRWKYSPLQAEISLADFGMGTLNGDTAMTFLLVLLTIILLFYQQSRELFRWRWCGALMFTLTIFVGNSEMQHLMILLVWTIYILTHLRLRILLATGTTAVVALGMLFALYRFGVLTFVPFQRTIIRLSTYLTIFNGQVEGDAFLSGNHARAAAIYYYITTPIRWLGDGPGAYYNAITRERIVGNWGHIFTFYSEVGIVGWALSILIFALIAFPFTIQSKRIRTSISWVQILTFIAINVLSIVKYPMNTMPVLFTYCVVLVGYQTLASRRTILL